MRICTGDGLAQTATRPGAILKFTCYVAYLVGKETLLETVGKGKRQQMDGKLKGPEDDRDRQQMAMSCCRLSSSYERKSAEYSYERTQRGLPLAAYLNVKDIYNKCHSDDVTTSA